MDYEEVKIVVSPYGCLLQTNSDRIRAMTDEELAEWVTTKGRTFGEE